jgi:hypothetical protein
MRGTSPAFRAETTRTVGAPPIVISKYVSGREGFGRATAMILYGGEQIGQEVWTWESVLGHREEG